MSRNVSIRAMYRRSSRALILARAERAGLVERAEEKVGGEPVRRYAVATGHGAGGEEGVQDRLLGRLRRGVEERRHALVRDHPERYGRREPGETLPRDATVARGEGEEDVAAPVFAAAAHPAEAYARAPGEAVALVRQERRVGGEDHDDGTLLGLVPVGRGDALRGQDAPDGGAVHAEHGPSAVVRLDEGADRPAPSLVGQPPRGRADAPLELVADHTRPPADRALCQGTSARPREGLAHVLGLHVLAVYVVQGAIVGLGDDGETPVLVLVGALLDLGGYEGVAHHADAVGVGDRDRGGEHAGLADPLQPRHLPVAVEAVAAGEDGIVAREALARRDDGYARPHRP